jgi:hypothetical protein
MKIFPVLDHIKNVNSKIATQTRLEELGVLSVSDKYFLEFNDLNKADAFLFMTHGLELQEIPGILNHPLIKQYPDKCFLWCDRDIPAAVLPGLFAALPSNRFDHSLHRTIFYLSKANNCINLSDNTGDKKEPKYLASFQGSLSSNIRKKLLSLKFKTSRIFINAVQPMWSGFIFGKGFDTSLSNVTEYAELMENSKFILCPKGNGVSSYRIFETLQSGKVPVIIADKYVAPKIKGADKEYMLFLKEDMLNKLEDFLLAKEKYFDKMSSNALTAYLENFSDEQKVHYLGEQLSDILKTSSIKTYKDLMAYNKRIMFLFRIDNFITQSKINIGGLKGKLQKMIKS